MNLKSRLKISFLIIILLPSFLAVMIGRTIVIKQVSSIQETYDVDVESIEALTNPVLILNRVTRDIFNRIKFYAVSAPDNLSNIEFIDELNNELKDKYSFIAVKMNNSFIYEGDKKKLDQIRHVISIYGADSTEVDGGVYIGGKNPVLIKQQDFYCPDDGFGTVYVVTDINNIVPQVKTLAIEAIISFILIVVFTAGGLIIWLYRSIIYPLDILKKATKQMRDGDLSQPIRLNSADEIGELGNDFEEMRIHLKELIDVKMQYEQNSRELLTNISHDLKTPLTAIKGYAEGIMDGVANTPEKSERYINTIYHKANEMTALVDELSMYAKLDNNSQPYNFKAVILNDYMDHFMEEQRQELEDKGITVIYENNVSETCKVILDIEQINRVLHNLINNSVKYMDKEQAKIRVSVREKNAAVEISIDDNGSGIEEKDLPYIFNRFFRADRSRNSSTGGNGLGLAIVKKIIEEHGGMIWASSIFKEGTSITFTVMKWSAKVLKEEKYSRIRKQMIMEVKD